MRAMRGAHLPSSSHGLQQSGPRASSSNHRSRLPDHHRAIMASPCSSVQAHQRRPQASSSSNALATLEDSWALLKDFTQKEFRGQAQHLTSTPAARERLRQALQAAYAAPHPPAAWVPPPATSPSQPGPELLLGVLASDARLALRALRDWCGALDLPYVKPELQTGSGSSSSSTAAVMQPPSVATVQGPVYVKYNSRTQQCYLSTYQGRDRGVLVQLGSENLGHFPLGLWDEGMARPPPSTD